MKIGKLYQAKPFHHNFDDFLPESNELKAEYKRRQKSGWDPDLAWPLILNRKDDWNIGPNNDDVLPIKPGQIIMVVTLDRLKSSNENWTKVSDVGFILNEKRYSATFNEIEWQLRFEEVVK